MALLPFMSLGSQNFVPSTTIRTPVKITDQGYAYTIPTDPELAAVSGLPAQMAGASLNIKGISSKLGKLADDLGPAYDEIIKRMREEQAFNIGETTDRMARTAGQYGLTAPARAARMAQVSQGINLANRLAEAKLMADRLNAQAGLLGNQAQLEVAGSGQGSAAINAALDLARFREQKLGDLGLHSSFGPGKYSSLPSRIPRLTRTASGSGGASGSSGGGMVAPSAAVRSPSESMLALQQRMATLPKLTFPKRELPLSEVARSFDPWTTQMRGAGGWTSGVSTTPARPKPSSSWQR